MSVDYYGCDSCGESRYEEFVGSCGKCGHSLCSWCLVNKDFESRYAYDYNVKFDGTAEQMEKYGFDESYDYEIGETIDDSGIDPKYCPYCNGLRVSNDDLLKYLIDKYKLDENELKEEYLKSTMA